MMILGGGVPVLGAGLSVTKIYSKQMRQTNRKRLFVLFYFVQKFLHDHLGVTSVGHWTQRD